MGSKERPHFRQLVISEGDPTDYRSLTDEDLFANLEKYDIFLDQETFLKNADQCDLPEEVVATLLKKDATDEIKADAYLMLCECWRRFCPEKQTLSIFCDELDLTMELFDKDQLGNEEYLQILLEELSRILDEAVDHGEPPRDVFDTIQTFFHQDLEDFLYNYIALQIDLGFETYASELIDTYFPYVKARVWFDFLRVKLAGDTDFLLYHLLDSVFEQENVSLMLEVLYYLISMGDTEKFLEVTLRTLPCIRKDEQLKELITMLREYIATLDEVDRKKILDLLPEGLSTVVE
ncbi:MAG: hypothetical protein SP1CHLAM54_13800 [Chlamydiia bacterium]|nr:hypothetical protein [Chlamydiia bacterium]MCH9616273.1 hypothetical protein [Chlamydiia bacterium]MCH9629741.1 hypothetical protein [Chlamydiia bacterium]